MIQVVKVQKPLESSDPTVPWLIYDKGRQHTAMMQYGHIPDWVKRKMGRADKAFFSAKWDPATGWTLLERLSDSEGF